VLELVDGRDYTKNDLTRLVDATAWYGSRGGGLAGRKDPHRMSDQESYCYSFAGARALDHIHDLRAMRGGPADDLQARTRDALISFCSAHRSGGEDYTVKQQILDRINRVVETFGRDVAEALPGRDGLLVPAGLPPGDWPVAVNDPDLSEGLAEVTSDDAVRTTCAVEAAENRTTCLDRTHRLWVRGPLPAGVYAIRPGAPSESDGPSVEESEHGLTLSNADGVVRFDAWNGGAIAEWRVGGFAPYRAVGALTANVQWQDAPLLDEVRGDVSWRRAAGAVVVECAFGLEDLKVTRRWRVGQDLQSCHADVRFNGRTFRYLAPFSYRLEPRAFGGTGQVLMVAEGCADVSSEPLMTPHNVHHLGSELLGFAGPGGLASIAVNRLCASPILRRNPLSGAFVLMDSRPIGHADDAFPYEFAQEPVFEATLRLEPGGDADTFRAWQTCHDHPPMARGAAPHLAQAEMSWMDQFPHISEVNPYF